MHGSPAHSRQTDSQMDQNNAKFQPGYLKTASFLNKSQRKNPHCQAPFLRKMMIQYEFKAQ